MLNNNDKSSRNDINNYNNHLPLIISGYSEMQDNFTSMECNYTNNNDDNNNNNNAVVFKQRSINLIHSNQTNKKNDKYKKLKNNNISNIDISGDPYHESFLIENDINYGNCIIFISYARKYNVYSMDNDKWLLNKNIDIIKEISSDKHALLFNQS